MLSFSIINYGFGASVIWLYAFRLYKSYKRKRLPQFKYAFLATLSIGLGLSSYFIFPFFRPKNSFLMGIGYVMGQIFVTLGFVATAKALAGLVSAKNTLLKFAPFLILTAGAIVTAIHIVYFGYPWLDDNGLIHWNQHTVTKIAVFILNAFIEVPIGIAFVLKSPAELKLKLKSIVFGLAFILCGTGGVLVVVFDNSPSLFLFYSIYFAGFLSFLITLLVPD